MVKIIAEGGNAGKSGFAGQGKGFRQRRSYLKRGEFGAGGHHFGGVGVGKLHDPFNHPPFILLEFLFPLGFTGHIEKFPGEPAPVLFLAALGRDSPESAVQEKGERAKEEGEKLK